MVEDSFSRGHVMRAEGIFGEVCNGGNAGKPGLVREFHSYQNQNHNKHAQTDSRISLADHLIDKPTAVAIGRDLRGFYESGASWEQVKPYIECIYSLENQDVPASAGFGFYK
jgi:hypothetical protein